MRSLSPSSFLRVSFSLALLAGVIHADEDLGRVKLRQAQRAADAGRPEEALRLVREAQVDLPDAAVVQQVAGDIHLSLEDGGSAREAYTLGLKEPYQFRGHFNRGVSSHLQAEQSLSSASVPLSVDALPQVADPAMIQAIEEALPLLTESKFDFLHALDVQDRPREGASQARESIAALNRRMDLLEEMLEELKEQEPPPEEGDQNQDEGETPSPQEPSPGDSDPSDESSSPDEPSPGTEEQSDSSSAEGQPQGVPRELTAEEVQQLLDQLEALEDQAEQFARMRQMQEHQTPEKDW